MIQIDMKPMTVNRAWKGRRYKTDEYKAFETELLYRLPPKIYIPVNHDAKIMEIYLEFGVSNSGSDWDNPIKPFVDVLQLKYGFNDKFIYDAVVKKRIVKKGDEYIKFELK